MIKKKHDGPHFVMVTETVLDSPAWQAMSHGARSLYIALKRRYWPNQKNNGTNAFWKHFASTRWNGHPQVIFDIFNEPDGDPSTRHRGNWSVWQPNMQALVNYLRNTLHVTNVLWADADNCSASFNDCPGLTDPNDNLIYSFHHPPDPSRSEFVRETRPLPIRCLMTHPTAVALV